jgi:hypothetical protein|tara:strand:- start:18 stop:755 length:738 start_codon:yes stop_codon:yes gene_type:complete
MDYSRIKFSSFTSDKNYCELQAYFQCLDTKENPEEPAEVLQPVRNLRITYKKRDDITEEDQYLKLSFDQDYCYEGLKGISDFYIKDFLRYKEDKGIFDEGDVSALVESRLSKIRDWKNRITRADYIEHPIKKLLRDEIDIFDFYLCQYLDNPNPNIKYRIQFNWIRTDVIYFFYLLRINGAIAEITDGDLGRILDSVMDYSDNDNFKTLRGSRKLLNDYRNEGGKPENPANNRLQEVFDDEFFNN